VIVPKGSHVCSEQVPAYCAVPNRSHICRDEILADFMVSNDSCVCYREILADDTVLNGSHACGELVSHQWLPIALIRDFTYSMCCAHLTGCRMALTLQMQSAHHKCSSHWEVLNRLVCQSAWAHHMHDNLTLKDTFLVLLQCHLHSAQCVDHLYI
jgi:hypothetical protein